MNSNPILILPYTRFAGQEHLKLALELAYIAPRIGGVLLSGERGTGKSTIVRGFGLMMYDDLPVTIPINATEDRIVGGWQIDELMRSEAIWHKGLLEEANRKLLYVDEVNLLDDHIVNIILDATSTGVLLVQREGQVYQKPIQLTLVGTMNPEEGGLRPQLLDRFGLMVQVVAETDLKQRRKILQTVLEFDEAVFQRSNGLSETFFEAASKEMQQYKIEPERACQHFYSVAIPEQIAETCVTVANEFRAEGHRGDYLMILAARAYAARMGHRQVELEHIKKIAPLVLQHRRPEAKQLNHILWSEADNKLLAELLDHATT